MQSTSARLLGPGSSANIPQSVLTQYSDATLFLLADFLELQIDQGETEPIFGRAFLYNVHSRSRISETFHFDTNSDNLLNLFTGSNGDQQVGYREVATISKSGLFRVSQLHSTEKPPTITSVDTTIRNPARPSPLNREADNHPLVTVKEEGDNFPNQEGGIIAPKDSCRQPFRLMGPTNLDTCFASGTFLVIRVRYVNLR